MRLWTWQKKGFDLTDNNPRVESLKNSFFLKVVDDPEHFKQVYTKLHETLGTSQFNWYFTEESEAKNQASHLQWFNRDCMLWEVKVPVGEVVFKTVCSITWGRLLNISAIPFRQLTCDWERLSKYDESLIEKWKQNFHDFWKDKSEEELWDTLFLEKCVDGCTDILLCHPLDDSWVVRNPIKEGKWWKMLNVNACRTPLHNSPLPCDGCSGRGASKICPGQTGETMSEASVRVNGPTAV